MKKNLCLFIAIVMVFTCLPQVFAAGGDNILFEDNFESYPVNTVWDNSNKTTGVNWGAKWNLRMINSELPVKVITENNGNAQGANNKALEIGVDFTSASTTVTNIFVETSSGMDFTSESSVTVNAKVRAPQGTSANTDRFDIMGVEMATYDGNAQNAGPVLIRFEGGGIKYNDNGQTTGATYTQKGTYTAGRWYDVTMEFTKLSPNNTVKLTVKDLVTNTVIEDTIMITAGFDIFKSTAGKFRFNNQPNAALKGTGIRTAAIDDFRISKGTGTPSTFDFVSSTPADGATGVATDTNMTVAYSENITNKGTANISNEASVVSNINAGNPKQLDLTFSGLQKNTSYTVTLSGVASASGTAATKTITFTTIAETSANVLFEDNFESYAVNTVWDNSNKTTGDNWGAKWNLRMINAGYPAKVITENNGNVQGASNKALEIGVDFTDSQTTLTNMFAETSSGIDFTSESNVIVNAKVRAPQGTSANTDGFYIMGVEMATYDGNAQNAGPVLIRFEGGGIKYNDNGQTTGATYTQKGTYTAGRWYDVTMEFTKLSPNNTVKLTVKDLVTNAVIEDTITITAGFDIFKSTAGKFRFNNQPNAALKGTGIRTAAIDDFRISKGTGTPSTFDFVSSTPSDGATGVVADTNMTVVYSENITNKGMASISNGASVVSNINTSNPKQLDLTFSGLQKNTSYTVTLSGVASASGTAATKTITFTTEADTPTGMIYQQNFESFNVGSSFSVPGWTIPATGANTSSTVESFSGSKMLKIGLNNAGSASANQNTYSSLDFSKGIMKIEYDYCPPALLGSARQRFDVQITNLAIKQGMSGDNWFNIITNFNINGGIRLSGGGDNTLVAANFEPLRLYKISLIINPYQNNLQLTVFDTVDPQKTVTGSINIAQHIDISKSTAASVNFVLRKNAAVTDWNCVYIDNIYFGYMEDFAVVSSNVINGETNVDVNTQGTVIELNHPYNPTKLAGAKAYLNGKSEDIKSIEQVRNPNNDKIEDNKIEIKFLTPLDEATYYNLSFSGLEDIYGLRLSSGIFFKTKSSRSVQFGKVKFYKDYNSPSQTEISDTGLVTGRITAVVPATSANGNATLVLGYYEEDRMVDIIAKTTTNISESRNLTIEMNVPSASIGMHNLQLYIWDKYNDCSPYERCWVLEAK